MNVAPLRAVAVDDEASWRELVAATLGGAGLECRTAASVAEAMAVLAGGDAIDVAVIDIGLAGPSGLTLVEHLTALFPRVAVVILTGHASRSTAADARAAGADEYLLKPVQPMQLVLGVDAAVAHRRARLAAHDEHGVDESVARLVRVAHMRDLETGHHSDRMSELCAALAAELGLGADAVGRIRRASLLHDIGKVGIPDEILRKPGRLTPDERCEMQRHARLGHQILGGSGDPVLQMAARIARSHHERWDGTGYPDGAAGTDIPIEGRIAAVADVFEALTSDRPYHAGMPVSEARRHIEEGAGTHFDPAVVEAFLCSELVGEVVAGMERARSTAATSA